MALIDVIKFDATSNEELVQKYPKEEIKLGSQLIVNQAQDAIFVRSGEIFDVFGPGTHTLATANIPLLNKIVNLPFGGDSPFSAEVWFVNLTTKRDLKWGTIKPIPLMDPDLGFPISVRAFGQWGYKIIESKSFLKQLVGTLNTITSETIDQYFIGVLLQQFTDSLSEKIINENNSIFTINTKLNELSDYSRTKLNKEFSKYGIELVNFDIININILEEEKKKIQEILAKKMEMEQMGKAELSESYKVMKSFETMEKAASNEGGGAGQMLGAGLGMGMGMGAGAFMGQQMGKSLSTEEKTDASKPTEELKSKKPEQSIEEKLTKIKELVDKNLIEKDEYDKLKQKYLSEL
jgi:membrane protease subunit (stomatin/prohibitin family)